MMKKNPIFYLLVFMFMSFASNVHAQDPCVDCDPSVFDPVCVVEQGDTLSFPSACYAECFGYDSTSFVSCNIILPPDPCNCGFVLDPTCVDDGQGNVLFFLNPCEAECAGFTASNFVLCDSIPTGGYDCYADFWYDIDWNNPLTVNFNDWSFGAETWAWDFGDGNTSTEQNPSHTYADDGVYDVTLTITGDSCTSTLLQHICIGNFGGGNDCDAFFFYTQDDPAVSTIDFEDASFAVSDITSWAWDFGDGNTSNEQNPSHTYADEGDYIVSLTINTVDSCESTIEYFVQVGTYTNVPYTPEDCQSFFLFSQDASNAMTINFEDLSFSQQVINEWFWDFGDGNTSTEQNPSHTYTDEGIYPVTLSIASDSCESNFVMLVFAGENAWYPTGCQALFLPLMDGTDVFLIDLSAGDVIEWNWDFGDGTTSNEQFPMHTYAATGNYDITLTILTSDGCTSSFNIGVNLLDNLISGNATQSYMTGGTTSNNEITFVEKIASYPNPVVDILNLDLVTSIDSDVQINIVSINGTELFGNKYSLNNGENKIQLDVSQLNSGVYFVEILKDDKVQAIKFVK